MITSNHSPSDTKRQEQRCEDCFDTGVMATGVEERLEFRKCCCGITSEVVDSLLEDLKETQGDVSKVVELGDVMMKSRDKFKNGKAKILFALSTKIFKFNSNDAKKIKEDVEEISNSPEVKVIPLTDENCRCRRSAVSYRVFKIIENEENSKYRIDIVRCNCEHVKKNGMVPELIGYGAFLSSEWTRFEITEKGYKELSKESKNELVIKYCDNLFAVWTNNGELNKVAKVNKYELISKVQTHFSIALDKITELETAYSVRNLIETELPHVEPPADENKQQENTEGFRIAEGNIIQFNDKANRICKGKKLDSILMWFMAKHPIFRIMSNENKSHKRISNRKIANIAEDKVKNRFSEYGNSKRLFEMESLLVTEAEERFLDYILHLWYKKTEFKTKCFDMTFYELHKLITGKANLSLRDKDRYREYLARLTSISIFDSATGLYFNILNSLIEPDPETGCKEIIRIEIGLMIFTELHCGRFYAFSEIYFKVLAHLGAYAYKILRFILSNDITKMTDFSLKKLRNVIGVSEDIKDESYFRRLQEGLKQLKMFGILKDFDIYKSESTGERILKLVIVENIDKVMLENVRKVEKKSKKNNVLALPVASNQ